ncbi:MAG TPA: non-homologous end-joining DNA ligase [Chthoniobacterales bacterium]|nr:non-homologous end-joining DNA ligase [Chthoniobacterales bacterium]
MTQHSYFEVNGKRVKVSNLQKVFYPATGFTKADVIDYYKRVSPVLLPHLKDRPISLKRYPDGVDGFFFYEKQCPSHRPEWINTARVPSQRRQGFIDYCVMNDESALVWAANLADLELHTFLHRAPELEHPDFLAIDLDPGAPANLVNCCEIALLMKRFFDQFDLQAFPKTSGSKGLQVYVPLNTKASYDTTKAFARAMAERLESENPDSVTSKMQKKLRQGKVFVDWSQNDEHKTTVSVYSLRAKEHPTVSTPVSWKEVADTAKKGDTDLLTFEAGEVLRRVKRKGDLFAPVLTLKQRLPNLSTTTARSPVR